MPSDTRVNLPLSFNIDFRSFLLSRLRSRLYLLRPLHELVPEFGPLANLGLEAKVQEVIVEVHSVLEVFFDLFLVSLRESETNF